jgi:hypothetical protein
LGSYVNSSQIVTLAGSYYSGISHFPLYNSGANDNGYIVNRIRPTTGLTKIYWDDSNIPGGTTFIQGQLGPAHTWTGSFGTGRTINTWWDGYKIDSMRVFQFHSRNDYLPIELSSFSGSILDRSVELKWATASETNNDYFTIEKSDDGINFTIAGYVDGSGNSNTMKDYNFYDNNPYQISYYRLKQTDFDGKYSCSKIIVVQLSSDNTVNIQTASSGEIVYVNLNAQESGIMQLEIYDLTGKLVYVKTINISEGQNNYAIRPELETGSLYLVSAGVNNQTPYFQKVYLN